MVLINNCCQNCGKNDSQLKKCTHCNIVFYCSDTCQMEDMIEHNKVCSVKNVASANGDPDGKTEMGDRIEHDEVCSVKNVASANGDPDGKTEMGDRIEHDEVCSVKNVASANGDPDGKTEMEDMIEHDEVCSVKNVASANGDPDGKTDKCYEEEEERNENPEENSDGDSDDDGYGCYYEGECLDDDGGCYYEGECLDDDGETIYIDRGDIYSDSYQHSLNPFSPFGMNPFGLNPFDIISHITNNPFELQLLNHPIMCIHCKDFKLFNHYCPICERISYCSFLCLIADYPFHRFVCQLIKKAKCAKCERSDAALKRCSRCNNVVYCSKVCQRADWKHHKTSCKTSKTNDDESSSKESTEAQCAKCKKSDVDLTKCSRCNNIEYCSKVCQTADWKHHKISCKTSETTDDESSIKRSVKGQCATCKRSDAVLKKCVSCNNVEYCSKVCQTADWEHHKTSCKTSKTKDDGSSSKSSVKAQCARCKTSDAVLKECSKCNNVEYCSKICQRSDWKDHKSSCKTSKTKDGESSSKSSVKGQCAKCKRSDAVLKKCVSCNTVEYCSKVCQTADWKHHKTSCNTLKNKDDESCSKRSVKAQCAKCKRSHVELTKCSSCNTVEYCSKVCQIADWEHHKTSCKTSKTKDDEISSKRSVKGQCANCNRSMKKCASCNTVEYCSKVCQKADWKHHKFSCKTSKAKDDNSSSKESAKSQCAKCKRSDAVLKKCVSCNTVEYCSKVCQTADWKHHKTSCKTSKTSCKTSKTKDDGSSSKRSVKGQCTKCKRSDAVLKKCSSCNTVEYCSKVCQTADWKHHKTSCKTSKTSCKTSKTKDDGSSSKRSVKDPVFPIPKKVDREICRLFPFQSVLTRFEEVTAIDTLPFTHKAKTEKLIAYIYKKGYHLFKLHYEIRDVSGEIKHVMFYHSELISLPYFRWNQLKVGNYIVIITPQIHHFLDGAVGFRINSLKDIRIIDN